MMGKNIKNDQNPGKWVLIWQYSTRAFQWIPTWQGLDGFQNFLDPRALDKSSLSIGRVKRRDWHWCLPHCPGQVEFVNYSWGASENYLACPTGQVRCIYFRFTFENICRFCGLASELVLENMLENHMPAPLHVLLRFEWNIIKHTFSRAGESWNGVSESWISLALLCKLLHKFMSCPDKAEHW